LLFDFNSLAAKSEDDNREPSQESLEIVDTLMQQFPVDDEGHDESHDKDHDEGHDKDHDEVHDDKSHDEAHDNGHDEDHEEDHDETDDFQEEMIGATNVSTFEPKTSGEETSTPASQKKRTWSSLWVSEEVVEEVTTQERTWDSFWK
jgi:hypothetical protein